MKHLTAIIICLSAIISCRKTNFPQENDGSRLKSIFEDTAGRFDFTYSNNKIAGIRNVLQNANAVNSEVIYSNTDSGALLSVVTISNSGKFAVNYLLSREKLPLRIFQTITENGISQELNNAKFVYQGQSSLLDSVVTSSSMISGQKIAYKVTYAGTNITKITATQMSATHLTEIAAFNFTYKSAPNIFRQTDSLLYVFSYPYSVFHAQPMVIATFFAEAFSGSTFNTVTTSGLTSNAWPEKQPTAKMTYQVNSSGKIVSESFDNPVFDDLAGKKYLYE